MQSLSFRVRCVDAENRPASLAGCALTAADVQALLKETLLSARVSSIADEDGDQDSDGEDTNQDWSKCITAETLPNEGESPVFSVIVANVSFQKAQVIRNFVLSGDFDNIVAHKLGPEHLIHFVADRSEFAEQFEQSALSLYNLTDHQKEKLAECYGEDGSPAGDVHLMAPAGAGKTFLALHRILRTLTTGPGQILFVARNEALAFFAATWLLKRLPRGRKTRRMIRRLHFLHEPFSSGVRFPRVRGNSVQLVRACGLGQNSEDQKVEKCPYVLTIVDEAHHIYSDDKCRGVVEACITPGLTQRMLLSDISQSWGRTVNYPEGLRDVMLYEVVRCSKRIVAGAMAFQLGGEEKLLTKCHHEATGPPLKSYLFDLPADMDVSEGPSSMYFQSYSEHVVRALDHVMTTFNGLNLRNRVAIVVPNNQFRDDLRPVLEEKLRAEFPQRKFRLVDSVLASSDLGVSSATAGEEQDEEMEAEAEEEREGEGEDSDDPMSVAEEDGPDSEWLLLDTIHQIDGLERLIVIGVGLDSIIETEREESPRSDSGQGEGGVLETRSMLYRAMTRAHLMFVVVNEFLRGGWLEFLGSVRLRQDEAFTSEAALQKCETQAVEGVVKARIMEALTKLSQENESELTTEVLNLLSTDVAQRHEAGQEESEAAKVVFSQWLYELSCAETALRTGLSEVTWFAVSPKRFQELTLPLAVRLHRGEIVQLAQAVSEVVKSEGRKQIEKDSKDGVIAARARCGRSCLLDEVIPTLVGRVVELVEEGKDLSVSAAQVVEDWNADEDRVRASFPEGKYTRELFDEAALKVSKGLAPQAAVAEVLAQIDQKERSALLQGVLNRCIDGLGPKDFVCRSGSRVKIQDEREGTLNRFDASNMRWVVKVDNLARPEAVQPRHVRALTELGSLEERKEFLRSQRSEIERYVDLCKGREGADMAEWVDVTVRRFRELAGLAESALEAIAEENDVDDSSKPRIVARTVVRYAQTEPEMAGLAEQIQETVAAGGGQEEAILEREVQQMLEHMQAQGVDPRTLAPEEVVDAVRNLQQRVQLEQRQRVQLQQQEEQQRRPTFPAPQLVTSAEPAAPPTELVVAAEEEEEEDDEADEDEDEGSNVSDEDDDDEDMQENLSAPRAPQLVIRTGPSALQRALAIELEEWKDEKFGNQSDFAELRSALEAAIKAQRLVLTDAAMDSLTKQLQKAVVNGEGLQSAVQNVLKDWQKQMVRRQVQQTIWDPSGNATKQVTGMVRFMPFKQQSGDHFDYLMLMTVFEMLPFQSLGTLARVCKRWRGIASDPSWKPEVVAYAWGERGRTGLEKACQHPTLLELSISKKILKVHCGDASTFLVTQSGEVWFWGASWDQDDAFLASPTPKLIPELTDIVTVTTSPPGYHHGRSYMRGYPCAALTRKGALYTWGTDRGRCLLNSNPAARGPVRVRANNELWSSRDEKVLHVALGLGFMAICIQRSGGEAGQARTAVLSKGCFSSHMFNSSPPHALTDWPQLRNLPIKELVAGNFHCCALTTRGELWTWGSREGADRSNGNLLGTGPRGHGDFTATGPGFIRVDAPEQVQNLGPVAEVRCSSYTTVAILLDGKVYTWGDCDGNALGHDVQECHAPHWIRSLRWHKVAHGCVAYTNGAVATKEGRVFVWGGNYWEGGISAQENANHGTAEVHWKGVPSCYKCVSVALSFKHGFLVFQKQP